MPSQASRTSRPTSLLPVAAPGPLSGEWMNQYTRALEDVFRRVVGVRILLATEIDFVQFRRDGVGIPVGGTYIDSNDFVRVVKSGDNWVGGTITRSRYGGIGVA